MGPHFFKCGKNSPALAGRSKLGRFNGAALFQVRKNQQYRFFPHGKPNFNGAALFQVRKNRVMVRRSKTSLCFNGAALFQVRKKTKGNIMREYTLSLQWGRTFSSAEKRGDRRHCFRIAKASMGPHFFKCGKTKL